MDEDELMMMAIEAGADPQFEAEEEGFTITNSIQKYSQTYTLGIRSCGIEMAQAEITMVPQTSATITAEADLKAWNKMMDLLEDDDELQEVYHNFEDSER